MNEFNKLELLEVQELNEVYNELIEKVNYNKNFSNLFLPAILVNELPVDKQKPTQKPKI